MADEVKRLAKSGAFASLSGDQRRGGEECLIHVYWTGHTRGGGESGHLVQRGKVSADLGLDAIPSPPFTGEEMQSITRAAKMAAIRCLRKRAAGRLHFNGYGNETMCGRPCSAVRATDDDGAFDRSDDPCKVCSRRRDEMPIASILRAWRR